jgi:anaerobic selenocysteine-containing dehydrogenase
MREGEQVVNALSLIPAAAQMHKAQAIPPFPSYGVGEQMRVLGLRGSIAGLPTAVLPDEILLPGDGQVRALISLGGNPATAFPDQLKTIAALQSLDLLVQTDPQMSATAALADYVIAPKLPFEVQGTTFLSDFGSMLSGFGYPSSYAQYTAAVVDPPADSDVIEHWEVLYGIAQGLGLPLELAPGLGDLMGDVGTPTALDMTAKPTTDELLELIHTGSRISLAEVKRRPGGAFYPSPEVWVEPKDPGWEPRLDVGSDDMMADLAVVGQRPSEAVDAKFPFRLISRRMMHVMNSPTPAMPANRPQYNPAFLNPEDLRRLGLSPGDVVTITSRRASIPAIVAADASVRESLVSMTHAFGGGPDRDRDVRRRGATPARLSTNDEQFDRYSGQPRMSNIPVRIEPVAPAESVEPVAPAEPVEPAEPVLSQLPCADRWSKAAASADMSPSFGTL